MRTAAIALLTLLASAPSYGELPAGFGWFAELAGACWVAQFPDGKTQHTQCYSTQFGRFLRGTAALARECEGKLQDQFSGDSVFSWDDQEKKIIYTHWGSDGSHSRSEAAYAGEELLFPFPSKKDPGTIAFRSVWRRIDANAFEVRREKPDGDGWKAEMTVVYRKRDAAR